MYPPQITVDSTADAEALLLKVGVPVVTITPHTDPVTGHSFFQWPAELEQCPRKADHEKETGRSG